MRWVEYCHLVKENDIRGANRLNSQKKSGITEEETFSKISAKIRKPSFKFPWSLEEVRRAFIASYLEMIGRIFKHYFLHNSKKRKSRIVLLFCCCFRFG